MVDDSQDRTELGRDSPHTHTLNPGSLALRTTVRGTGKLGSNSNPSVKMQGSKWTTWQIQSTHPSLSSFQVLSKEEVGLGWS